MDTNKYIKNFVLLAVYEGFVSLLSVVSQVNLLVYVIFSWIIPTIFYLFLIKRYRIKIVVYGILWSFPLGIIFDFLGVYNKAWAYWDNPLVATSKIFILGSPVEAIIWGISFWLFCIVL
ncbi:MAG: hypothetical protein ACMG57_04495, partial [Candidatus Dojkabacteria bacterium]